MFVLTESSVLNPGPGRPRVTSEVVLLEKWLPALLSVIAGTVDVIGFLTLGLFTAHITGNLVVIAALLVRGGSPNLLQILAVPIFAIAVAVVWRIAKALEKSGHGLARPLLVFQFLLLAFVLIFSIIFRSLASRQSWMSVVIAMTAVSAMACQSAFLHLVLVGAPSTAVMTGNLTSAVLSLLDMVFPRHSLEEDARGQLIKTLKVVVGFCAGCLVGAAAVSFFGAWAWSVPVVLAGLAVLDSALEKAD
jgi:uncharacterized membrane protein YoaK (UPF0700 family)